MTKENIHSDPYKLAGVDIDAGNDLIHKIKADVQSTANSSVLGGIGGFAGMYKLPTGLKTLYWWHAQMVLVQKFLLHKNIIN